MELPYIRKQASTLFGVWLSDFFWKASLHTFSNKSTFHHAGIDYAYGCKSGLNRKHLCSFLSGDLQRSVSINNRMASSRPNQHVTSVLGKTRLNGTDCCTLHNSSPVELPQQESGDVCTWKWQLKVRVHLRVSPAGTKSSSTDGEECPRLAKDQD